MIKCVLYGIRIVYIYIIYVQNYSNKQKSKDAVRLSGRKFIFNDNLVAVLAVVVVVACISLRLPFGKLSIRS
jgi:hypothetical protein